MSTFVPAASVAVAWIFDDEDEPRADAALTYFENDAALTTLDTGSPEPPSPKSSPEPPSPKGSC